MDKFVMIYGIVVWLIGLSMICFYGNFMLMMGIIFTVIGHDMFTTSTNTKTENNVEERQTK